MRLSGQHGNLFRQREGNGRRVVQIIRRHLTASGQKYLLALTTYANNPLARDFSIAGERKIMWYNGNYPAAYQHQPVRLRQKALEIANNLVAAGMDESIASEIGLREAREFFRTQRITNSRVDPDLPAIP
jgi:hypothetical protein